MSRHRSALLLSPGSDTAWRDGSVLTTQPTAVAVDGNGVVRAYGSEAVLHAARRRSGLRLVRPYSSIGIDHHEYARAYVGWIAGHHRAGRSSVLAVIEPADPPGLAETWQALGGSLGIPTVTVSRPLAAGEGLGLDVDSAAAHMIVDLRSDTAEVSVVAEGTVLLSHQVGDPNPRQVASVTRSLLIQIDPDLECDIADSGIYVLGPDIGSDWPREFARLIRIPVDVAGDQDRVIFDGAASIVKTLQPYLPTLVSGVGGRLKAVLAGFAH